MDEAGVEQFCNVTGSTEDVARNYLEACGNNLEAAVELYFKQTSNIADEEEEGASTSSNIRRPIPRKSDTLVRETFNDTYAPFRRARTRNSVFDKFRDLEAETVEHTKAIKAAAAAALSANNNNDDDVVEIKPEENGKRKTLEALFRPPLELMHHGNFESAKNEAVRKKRWLLVNVQNVEEFACQALNRDVWNHHMVLDLIRGNFVLWQIYNDSADGNRFCTYYPVESYPFVCVIDPLTGELINIFRILKDTAAFCDSVVSFLESHPIPFDFETQNENSLCSASSNSSVDNSDSAAVQSSLKRKLTQSTDSKGSTYENADTLPKYSKTNDDTCQSLDYNATLNGFSSKENWKDFCSEKGKEIQIMFRLPDGKKHILRLKCESKLKAIELYAMNELNLPFGRFSFLLNHPKRVLNDENPSATLEELDFNDQEIIYVED